MFQKKTGMALALLLAVSSLLSACGKSGEAAADAGEEKEPITLTFFDKN